MNGCGIRDWYLSHVSHSPHIPFPLRSYTLDVCSNVQIKPKVREEGLCPQTRSSTAQQSTSFCPDHNRGRISNAVIFWGTWSGMGMRDTMHKAMGLLSQGWAKPLAETKKPGCTDCCRLERPSLASNSSAFFCTHRYSRLETMIVFAASYNLLPWVTLCLDQPPEQPQGLELTGAVKESWQGRTATAIMATKASTSAADRPLSPVEWHGPHKTIRLFPPLYSPLRVPGLSSASWCNASSWSTPLRCPREAFLHWAHSRQQERDLQRLQQDVPSVGSKQEKYIPSAVLEAKLLSLASQRYHAMARSCS